MQPRSPRFRTIPQQSTIAAPSRLPYRRCIARAWPWIGPGLPESELACCSDCARFGTNPIALPGGAKCGPLGNSVPHQHFGMIGRLRTDNPAGDSTQRVLRTNTAITVPQPSSSNLCGWPMSAEVTTSTCSPFSMRSRIRSERPNCIATARPMRLAERRGDLRHHLAHASRFLRDKVFRPCLCHQLGQHHDGHSELGHCADPFFKGRPQGSPIASRVSSMISSMLRPGLKAANPSGRATPSGMRGQVSTSAITVRTGIFAA